MHKHTASALLTWSRPLQKIAFWALLALLALCSSLYMYFVVHSISQVLARIEFERQIAEKSSSVADLELRYVARKDELNANIAQSLGLEEPRVKFFAAKKMFAERILSFNVR